MKPAEEFYNRQEAWNSPEELEWLTLLFDESNPNCRKAREMELAKCQEDPWYFLTRWVKTENAANKLNPCQPFPNDIHLQVLTHAYNLEQYLLVPKSRQMTVTWWACALALHDTMFFKSRYSWIQNKKEEDSDQNLERIFFIWSNLPQWMKDWQPCTRTYCLIDFPDCRGKIKAIPAGAHHVRSATITLFLCDEMAFTEETDELMAAVKPALGEHGKFMGVSSAAPSYFKQLVFDEV